MIWNRRPSATALIHRSWPRYMGELQKSRRNSGKDKEAPCLNCPLPAIKRINHRSKRREPWLSATDGSLVEAGLLVNSGIQFGHMLLCEDRLTKYHRSSPPREISSQQLHIQGFDISMSQPSPPYCPPTPKKRRNDHIHITPISLHGGGGNSYTYIACLDWSSCCDMLGGCCEGMCNCICGLLG
jgi:hypothetical protein